MILDVGCFLCLQWDGRAVHSRECQGRMPSRVGSLMVEVHSLALRVSVNCALNKVM